MVKILAFILLVLMLVVGRDRGLQAFLTILMNVGILAAVLYAVESQYQSSTRGMTSRLRRY